MADIKLVGASLGRGPIRAESALEAEVEAEVEREDGHEHRHDHEHDHEHCKCHADQKTIGGEGTREDPFKVIGNPPFLAFPTVLAGETVTTTIYANATGSDVTGNGTAAQPYGTFARAILDVPQVINSGYRYVVDITGLGVELLPQDWTTPPVVADSDGWIDPAPIQPYLIRTAPLVIRALPQLALPGTDAIISPADAAVVSTVGPDLCSITISTGRGTWAAGALKGKQIVRTVGGSAATCCIYDSSATTLFLCNTASALNGGTGPLVLAPGETINIVEPSATLTAPPSPKGDPITWSMTAGVCFQGIKFVCTVPDSDNGSINLNGALVAPFFELCDIDGADFVMSGGVQVGLFSTTMRDYCNAFSTQLTPRRSYWDIPEGLYFDGGVNQFRTTVFEVGSSINSAGAGVAGPAPAIAIAFLNCWFLGAPGDAITMLSPTSLDMTTCQIDDSAGNAITASGPCRVALTGVTGTGNAGFGVQTDDGAHVQVDAATTVIGALGAYKNGSHAPVAVWPGVTFSDPDLDTLSRVWEP